MSDNPVMEPVEKFYGKAEVSEPIEPTEAEAVTSEVVEPKQDAEQPEVQAKAKESEAKTENKESYVIEIDGEQIDLEDVKKWRDGHFMQSDYTKKTTAHARKVEADNAELESKREQLKQESEKLTEMQGLLKVLVAEDDSIDWAGLRASDPDKYIEMKERADARREALANVQTKQLDPEDIKAEQAKFFEANPEWFDADNKPTEAYTKDTALINAYAAEQGYTAQEFSEMTKARYLLTMLKAAKFDQLHKKGEVISKAREKVPVVIKPKAKQTEQPKSRAELYYGT